MQQAAGVQVYLASGMILTGNTGTLDAAQLLALGEAQVNTFIPDAAGLPIAI